MSDDRHSWAWIKDVLVPVAGILLAIGWGDGNDIRFEPASDAVAMAYLYRFIAAKNPGLMLRENPVHDTSRPNSIAIHLPPPRS